MSVLLLVKKKRNLVKGSSFDHRKTALNLNTDLDTDVVLQKIKFQLVL